MLDASACFGILIIGDEILSGHRQDRHLAKVIEILAKRDLELAWARYAGDDEVMLTQHFREIRALGHHCFSFGGIGATVDDRTRQAVAAAFDRQLRRHPAAAREIEAQFGEQAYPNRILMAELPEDAELIPNFYNRIPGFGLGNIHCLPGFPQMAWPMMEWVLDTKYSHLATAKTEHRTLVLQNVHESDLIDLLAQIQHEHPQIKLSSLPSFLSNGHRKIELGIKGLAEPVEAALQALRQRLHAQGFISAD